MSQLVNIVSSEYSVAVFLSFFFFFTKGVLNQLSIVVSQAYKVSKDNPQRHLFLAPGFFVASHQEVRHVLPQIRAVSVLWP